MESKRTLTALIADALKQMERLQYAESGINTFRRDCNNFSAFVQETTGNDDFTEEIGARYLKEKYNYPPVGSKRVSPSAAEAVLCIRRLGEYDLCGAWARTKLKGERDCDWSLGDKAIISAYLKAVQTSDNSERTKEIRNRLIERFYKFLDFRGVNGISEMSGQIISDYAVSLQGLSTAFVGQHLSTLRCYFLFLHKKGLCSQDWSLFVPKVIVRKNLKVPTLWEKPEIELLLKSIDRGSPSGKRNYAIILLAVQLGLRVSDIVNLKLHNLKWEHNELELVQQKTGKRMVQPLLDDSGWAIIDYLKNARPNVEEPYVFITLNAPYTKISTGAIGAMLHSQMRFCGIVKREDATGGMHSLRHTLARRLLRQGTPLPEVADIMGHVNYLSTSPYLKVDIDGLRECGLSLEEVFENA
jgi:site-specific recombinase XerD